MFISKIVTFFICSALTLPAAAIDTKDLLPPEKAFLVSAAATSANEILLTWEIAEGYYLYRNKMRIESQSPEVSLANIDLPPGKIKQDQFFGEVAIYRNKLQIPVQLQRSSDSSNLKIALQYQGCADIGICYPPQNQVIEILLPAPPKSTTGDSISQLFKQFQGIKLNLFQDQDELLPPDQAFQFFASIKDVNTIQVTWEIAENYYLYRDKIDLALLDAVDTRIGNYSIPRGIPEEDEAFGKVEIFLDQLSFDAPLIRQSSEPSTINLQAKYQGCAVRGVCYPPMQKTLVLQLPAAQKTAAAAIGSAPKELSEQDQIIQSLHQDTLWLTLISFFGFGLLLSFTPCIFPMIPILSGIIVGQGKNITTRRAFFLSLSYVLASAVTYTVFGIIAALFGSNLQSVFQEPWVIILFSTVFVLLAFSMFGFFTLEMPKAIQARLHNSSETHRDGSLIGAAIMGALSTLIVGPCVAAPLAGALIYIGQTGDAVLGGSALFMMGLGMGFPLLMLGASAGKLLPKAGHWLNSTKAIFGVIMLAVAVWMLERILPSSITMLLWAVLLIIPAIYMSAIDPLPENVTGWRKLWKGAGLMMLTYGILLLIGLSMGNSNPLKPLQGVGLATAATEQPLPFQRITSVRELDERLLQAHNNNQWVMLDYYADWCITCKEMEHYTFTDPQVQQRLSKFILLQADVTKNSAADQELLKRFSLIGPPAILFFAPGQNESSEFRIIGYQDVETFISHLQRIPS
jgi:thioredoxin:protein disulfide reductase